jgi:O-antigen/teichoic acid export membrane protein
MLSAALITTIKRFLPHAARASWAVADASIGPVLLILMAPFLLQSLGVGGFGLWVFAISITGFGQLASIGVGVTTTKHVSSDLGAGKPDQAIATTRAALTVASMGGGLLLLIMAPLATYLAETVFVKMGANIKVAWALLIGVALLIAQEVDAVFSGALRGAQRYDIAAKVELILRPIWAITILLTAWIYKEPIAALIASLGINILKLCLKGIKASSLLGGNCFAPSRVKADIRRTIDFGKWVWLQGVGSVLFGVLDRILIGALFGAADLGRYSICLQLAQFVHSIQAAAIQILMPWVSEKISKNKGINIILMNKLTIYAGGVCLVLPLIMVFFSATILRLWISPSFAVENSQLCMMLFLAYGILSFNIPRYYLLLGIGRADFVAVLVLLAGIAAILSSLAFLSIGVSAFALGKIVYAIVALSLFIPLKSHPSSIKS